MREAGFDSLTGSSVRIVIPFLSLARDNERLVPTKSGRLVLGKKYRGRKGLMAELAAIQVSGEPLEGPLRIHGVAYWPDRRKRDLLYFTKALHDTLQGIAYVDDVQLVDVHYILGPLDKANPRVELDIEPISHVWYGQK